MGAQALLTKCVFNCPICVHLDGCENARCLSLSEREFLWFVIIVGRILKCLSLYDCGFYRFGNYPRVDC